MSSTISHSRKKAPILTKTQSKSRSNCRLSNQTIHKTGGGRSLQVAEADPELIAIVTACRRFPEGHKRAGKALPASCDCSDWQKHRECEHAQTKAWCRLRDEFANKNYNLPWRAAQLQWRANQHLAGERIRCRFCPGKPTCDHELQNGRCPICLTGCNRCFNSGYYVTQPDLENLAYGGLLEAIRNCDFSKGGMKISTYAIWLMKHAMMSLLRQTPVFFPQELLRDRRVIRDFKKKAQVEHWQALEAVKGRKLTSREKEAAIHEPTTAEVHAALGAVRKCKQTETLEERRLLAEGCYYGQEKSSVEQLQSKYVERSDKSEKRQRKNKAALVIESLCVQPIERSETADSEDLQAALQTLPPENLKLVRQFLRGKLAEVPEDVLGLLRAEML